MNAAFAAPRQHDRLRPEDYYVFRGEALTRLGPEGLIAARELFDSARVTLETGDLRAREPLAAASGHVWMGRAYLGLGKTGQATREAQVALEGLSKVEDGYSGPVAATYAALILAESGAAEKSIAELTRLLKIPSPVSGCLLRTEPWASTLGGSPSFQRLLATNPCLEAPGPVT